MLRSTFFLALVLSTLIVGPYETEGKIKSKLKLPTKTVNDYPSLCPSCISFMDQALDILLNVIANGGVLGGCADLCGYLPTELEADVCELLCDYVGIEAFIDAINVTDPDPIWICMEIDICPINDNAAGSINSASVVPTKGSAGTMFNVPITYTITTTTGTAQLLVIANPPDGSDPFGEYELLIEQPPGKYQVTFQLDSTPSEGEPMNPGVYNTTVLLCEGSCGSSHSHSFTMASKNIYFTITQ